MVVLAKVGCPLRNFISLQNLVISNRKEIINQVQQEVLAMVLTPSWAAKSNLRQVCCQALVEPGDLDGTTAEQALLFIAVLLSSAKARPLAYSSKEAVAPTLISKLFFLLS